MKLPAVTTGTLLTLLCLCCAWLYLKALGQNEYRQAFKVKGAAALCFCALGLLTARFCSDRAFSLKIVLGLFMGLVGDELLALRRFFVGKRDLIFALGSVAFGIGHFLYISAVSSAGRTIFPLAVLFAAMYAAVSFAYAFRKRMNAGKMQIFAVVYILVVVFMAACASACAVLTRKAGAILFALGGICFAVSDNLLCSYQFGEARTPSVDLAVHVSYYAAQLLIAWSIAFF